MNSTPSAKTEQYFFLAQIDTLSDKSEHFNTSTWVYIKKWNVHRLLWIGKQEHKETHTGLAWMKYCDSWVCYTPKATTLEYYVEKLKSNFPLRVKYQAEQ